MKNTLKRGFTLVEIMIVVAIIGLLASIAIPNFIRARKTAQTSACVNNLRLLSGAVDEWALERNKPDTAVATMPDLQPYLKNNQIPVCPTGGDYTFGKIGDPFNVKCSIAEHESYYEGKTGQ